MSTMRFVETCSCSATVTIEGSEIYTKHAAIEWRKNHRHEAIGLMLERLEAQVYGDDGFIAQMVEAQAAASEARSALQDVRSPEVDQEDAGGLRGAQSLGPELATADDVIEGRARYADTPGGHADAATKKAERARGGWGAA